VESSEQRGECWVQRPESGEQSDRRERTERRAQRERRERAESGEQRENRESREQRADPRQYGKHDALDPLVAERHTGGRGFGLHDPGSFQQCGLGHLDSRSRRRNFQSLSGGPGVLNHLIFRKA
jgi:hypothetical protein